MKRTPPRMTQAQSRAIADDAHARTVRPLEETRSKDLEEMLRSIEETERHNRRALALLDRIGLWVARILVLPAGLAAVAELLVIAWGLWSGEIHEAGKYQRGYVLRDQSPVFFWVTCGLHALYAAFCGWLAAHLVKATGWLGRGR